MGGDAGALGRDQRARELRFAEHRLARDHYQDLVEVGGELLGLPFVLPEQQVAAWLDVLDDTFVAGRLPAHAVADDAGALLAARVAQQPFAVGHDVKISDCPDFTLDPGAFPVLFGSGHNPPGIGNQVVLSADGGATCSTVTHLINSALAGGTVDGIGC